MLGEGVGSAEFNGYLDTGCYTLNMISSGSLFNGIPNNSFTGFAGESTTGKTFFALAIAKNFLENIPDSGVLYADSESAVRKAMAENRGMDGMRITQFDVDTVEAFRTKMLHFLNNYGDFDPEERMPLLVVLDSLGNLSTNKELEDTATVGDTKEAEKKRNTKDMTRAPLIKGSFRVLRLKMAKLKVPMIITNHVYANISGYGPQKEMGGGSGLKYAADTIYFLSKSKAKAGDASDGEVIGSKITIRAVKSRLGRENAEVQALLNYDTGLDKYYGLMDMAEECGVFQKAAKGLILPGGTTASRKEILKNPDQVYTQEVLQAIDEAARPNYVYGSENPLPYISPDDELENEEA
jgi:RecA/RadA recombinase